MKLVVFGATGKTGLEVVKGALAQGHEVSAFVREPSKISIDDDHLTLVTGDIFDLAAVAEAVKGQEAVVCSLGSNDLGRTTVRSEGTANIIKAMKESDVQRLVVVSAMGVGESWSTLSLTNRLFFATVLRSARKDHEAQEAAVKASDLDWTIVRPSGLTDTPLTGNYQVGENIRAKTSQIARADVADLILKVLDDETFFHKAVTITN